MKLEEKGVQVEDRELAERLVRSGAYLIDEKWLPLYEACYFAEKGILPVEKKAVFAALKKRDKAAEIRYKVFGFLWNRGYITRESLDSELFRIYRKGIRIGEDRTEHVMRVIGEKQAYSRKNMKKDLEMAGAMRKQFVLAIAGKDIRFIKISRSRFD